MEVAPEYDMDESQTQGEIGQIEGEAEGQEEDVTHEYVETDADGNIMTQTYVEGDGTTYQYVDDSGNTQYVEAEEGDEATQYVEAEGDEGTHEEGGHEEEHYVGDMTEEEHQGVVEGEEDLITQTIIDEDGNQQIITGSAAAIQDLITLHGLDAHGNIMAARAPGEVDPDEDLDNVHMGMDQSSMESMMDTENIVEEVITGHTEHENENEDGSFSLTTNEPMPTNSDLSNSYLNIQEAVFNPATGTLQPIESLNAQSTPKPPAPKSSKKKQSQQPVTKYVIAQGGDQGQQLVLDAQQLQGLLQGGGNTLTFSGASGKQSIFLAPQSSTPHKAKTTKSPAKILPAPVPIGDQQQQASAQRFLLKQGTVLTPLGQMSQGGTTKLIQMPSTGPNQPIQYLRVVQKQPQTPGKVPIAPATYKPKPVAPKPSPGQTIFTLPSGATADLSSLQNVQGLGNYVVLNNQNYVVKSEHNTPVPIRPAHDLIQSGISETAAILGGMGQNITGHGSYESFRSLLEPNGMRPRKPCNCTKSQCLKLYCDCFANGEFCHLCNCTNCYNNLNHEEDRQKAIKLVLERNPGAFRPKIGKSSQTGEAHERRHNKGCNCRRSGCLKNYCECYEAKIFCSGICKCTGCKNCIENIPSGLPNGVGVEQHFAGAGTSHRQTLKDLAEAAEVRVQQQTQVKNKMKAQMQEVSPQNNLGIMVPPVVFRYPHGSISYDVVTSTVEVLLAKAEAIERQRLGDGELEKSILEEFGDCLSALMELGSTVGVNNNFN